MALQPTEPWACHIIQQMAVKPASFTQCTTMLCTLLLRSAISYTQAWQRSRQLVQNFDLLPHIQKSVTILQTIWIFSFEESSDKGKGSQSLNTKGWPKPPDRLLKRANITTLFQLKLFNFEPKDYMGLVENKFNVISIKKFLYPNHKKNLVSMQKTHPLGWG